jgi:uncharacterized ferritin-like protein (DUF455 family)
MELRDFAERILFATTLEEKLQCPAAITDEHPGPALPTPGAPGRPPELRFKQTGTARDQFPDLRQLERLRERGRLLHFFVNHELLATELMALVLLRFPDASPAFRKGVLQTLKDEQMHTRLYLQRMRESGIHFGELPVSGYFWRAVSGMENPMDYVSSLCLTFEQANLDFARHFASSFATVGDDTTAKLLDKIYHDEIAHVAYGLKWFRRWKNPSESDWEAFCRQLKFPLSPQRAKGFTLNVEGRRAAGLDERFIAELDVYSQSKGRTPNVFVFNPFAEARMAQGPAFNPTQHQAQLARDLENLPQFLCRQDDIVLVERRPSVEFLSGIKQAGFALPEFLELDRRAELTQRKLGGLRPWAWGPDSVELFEPLFANLTGENRTANRSFNPDIAQLYSKAWSAALLRQLLTAGRAALPRSLEITAAQQRRPTTNWNNETWLCPVDDVGVAVETLDEALDAIAAIRRRGHHKIAVKESLGLAGSNAIRLFEPALLETHRRWIEKALEKRRQLVVEPWLERVLDFSVQLEMTQDGLKLCGYTGLINDARGQFQGNVAAPGHEKKIPANVISLLQKHANLATPLHALYASIFSLLEAEFRRVEFLGPVGIDACVYCDADDQCCLKPIVEINPRYTMGRLTVELMKHVTPGSYGLFRLLNRKQARGSGFDDFASYARSLQTHSPLRLEGEPTPRIREGAICLNEPMRAEVCLALLQVAHGEAGFATLADLIASNSSQRA